MATERQTEANRQNAQNSCGPRTETGKAKSSQNALKHGLDAKTEVMRCENREEYEALTAVFYADLKPVSAIERSLVDALVKAEWLSCRYMGVEGTVWECGFNDIGVNSAGWVFKNHSEVFARAGRLRTAAQRDFSRALKDLRDHRARNAAGNSQETIAPAAECAPQPVAEKPADCVAAEEFTRELASFHTSLESTPDQQDSAPEQPQPLEQQEQQGGNQPPIAA